MRLERERAFAKLAGVVWPRLGAGRFVVFQDRLAINLHRDLVALLLANHGIAKHSDHFYRSKVLHASFIADGIHIPPTALKVMLRAKGLARSILVTDATSAAATPLGIYEFAGMKIEHTADGSVREPGSSVLAGSALSLDQAVRNVVNWGLASPMEAIGLASANPIALLGVEASTAWLEWDADLRPSVRGV